jgi:hypothetical protein
MRRIPNLAGMALVVLTAAMVSSCSYNNHLIVVEENRAMLSIRAEFLQANPDGIHNASISRGEVVKGMGFMEVLASWGLPEARERDQEKGLEYWSYFFRDDDSRDWVRYTFTFEKTELTEWDTARHVARNQPLAGWEALDTTEVPPAINGDTFSARKR